jgi:ubiquinone/menaquinone biosynthesis C-methylase UbiE
MAALLKRLWRRIIGGEISIASNQQDSDFYKSFEREQNDNFNNFFEAYKARLKRFNETDKYRHELLELFYMIDPDKKDKILDYGCGTGHAVKHFRMEGYEVYGYDYFRYVDGNPSWYIQKAKFKFDHIYFMHSFAHIPNIEQVLINMRQILKYGGTITVLTPNKNYLDMMDNDGYVPDPTVVRHYTYPQINKLFTAAGYKYADLDTCGDSYKGVSERLICKYQIR